MRIVLVTHYFPAHRGGVEIVAGEIAARLARRHGASITWHASDTEPPPSLHGVACVPARACNVIERRWGLPYPLWSPRALWRLARAARKADAVHLHDCLYLPNVFAYIAARMARRPILVTQHVGMVPYRNPVLRMLLYLAYRVLGRLVLGGATQTVFVSDAVRRYFERFAGFRAPPALIANGVDLALFHPVDQARRAVLRADLEVRDATPILLFVGRFVEKKGLALLRQLAAALPHARWLFAGWGPMDPEQWGLPQVRVLRGLSGAGLAPLYQAADLLVLPSSGEGFPLVVQEAMACGTPALVGLDSAAACPQAAPLLLSEDTEAPGAAQRWEQRIRELTAGASLRALRPQVAEFAAANWSWERCAESYAAILRGWRKA